MNTSHMPNRTQSINHEFGDPGIQFSFTERPDTYTGKNQYAGVVDSQKNIPTSTSPERSPCATNHTNYCAIAFTSENSVAVNPGLGCYQTGQFFLPASHSVGTVDTELGYLVGVRAGGNSHVSEVVYDDVPYVIDGYDHEKALLIRFAARVYIEEVTVAEIAAEKITDAKRAERAQIVVEEKVTLAVERIERDGETASAVRNVAERNELMAVAAEEYAAMRR